MKKQEFNFEQLGQFHELTNEELQKINGGMSWWARDETRKIRGI
ncbi:bacteriocin class II family protein [Lactococcus lactis]|nr:bacteriocin class II family protein [Lactococcus lactis]